MGFWGGDVGCGGGEWAVKCYLVSFQCDSKYVHLFLMSPYITDNATVCDLGALWDLVSVDLKKVLVPLVSPNPWKSRTSSLDATLINLCLLWTFVR